MFLRFLVFHNNKHILANLSFFVLVYKANLFRIRYLKSSGDDTGGETEYFSDRLAHLTQTARASAAFHAFETEELKIKELNPNYRNDGHLDTIKTSQCSMKTEDNDNEFSQSVTNFECNGKTHSVNTLSKMKSSKLSSSSERNDTDSFDISSFTKFPIQLRYLSLFSDNNLLFHWISI